MTITPLMPVYPRCGVRPVRGEGAYLIGERGERYLDFASGIAVNLLGHGHPHLTKAIQEQILKNNSLNLLAVPGAFPVEGGVPLVINNQVVGAIGVSGGMPADDGDIANAGAKSLQP